MGKRGRPSSPSAAAQTSEEVQRVRRIANGAVQEFYFSLLDLMTNFSAMAVAFSGCLSSNTNVSPSLRIQQLEHHKRRLMQHILTIEATVARLRDAEPPSRTGT